MAPPKKKKSAPPGRAFRRLDERVEPTAPLPVAWAAGLVLGGVGGLAAMAWDLAAIGLAGLAWPVADLPHVAPWLLGHAALGGGLGLVGGATGLFGPRWATATAFAGLGWVLCPPVVGVAQLVGLPGAVGIAVGVLAGGVAGQVVGRIPFPAYVHGGFAGLVYAGALVAGPLHEHVLASSTSIGALAATAAAVAIGLPFAGAAALGARDGRPPILSLAASLLGGIGLALALRPAEVPVPEGAEGTTVTVVAVDGLRVEDLERMPAVSRWAKGGVAYGNAWSTANWSVPALGSILTGLWPYDHFAGLHDGRRQLHTPLDPRVPTLASATRAAGFATVAVVGDVGLRRYDLDRGFDVWERADDPGEPPAFAAPLRRAGLGRIGAPPTAAGTVDRALARAAEAPGRSRLMLVHLDGGADPAALDGELGRLLDGLDRWVVLVGTHGRPTIARTPVPDGEGVFVELVRVPLVVRGPGVAPLPVYRPVSVVDVFATALGLTGASASGRTEPAGRPLAEVLGAEVKPDPERLLFVQSGPGSTEYQGVVKYPHLLVRVGERASLFDLVADPLQNDPLRMDGQLDQLQRGLEAALPTDGRPAVHGEGPGPVLQLGRIVSRALGRR